jgi:hypothetical protein
MTADAAMMLLQKKKALRKEIVPDLDRMIESAVSASTERIKKEIEEKYLKDMAEASVKPTHSTLFKASETDYSTLLEQRRKVMGVAKPPTDGSPDENIYVDFSKGTPTKLSPAASDLLSSITPPEGISIAVEEEKK